MAKSHAPKVVKFSNILMKKQSILVVFLAILGACQGNDATQNSSKEGSVAAPQNAPLPNTPELVVRAWETEVAQNEFALARQLSIGEALATVVAIDSSNLISKEPMEPYTPNFLEITCQEKGNEAVCNCVVDDGISPLRYQYYLIRQNGQWYLDHVSEPVEEKIVNKKPQK